MGEKQKRKKQAGIKTGVATVLVAVLAVGGYLTVRGSTPKGYQDYTVQKEQYYVEYSDLYDYWDVITVEYPVLSDMKGDQATAARMETINKLMYDMAMEKVNYWHLSPNEDVKKLQEKYKIYSSDVRCEVPFHSQYLMSVHYRETYAPISPVNYIHKTQRSANINLMTGEMYTLSDIFRVDEDFVGYWCEQVASEGTYGELILNDADTREAFLSWFLDEDEEAARYYMFTPFFYIDENKDFVIGLSFDPKPDKVVEELPMENSFLGHFESGELVQYRTESEFWNWYEQSESSGKVLACVELKENLWLGKDASVWDYLEKMGRLEKD